MLDRLTDLDDHELDEQAAIFLHSKNSKRTSPLHPIPTPQVKLLAINVKRNINSDIESAATSYEEKNGLKIRVTSESLLGDKRGAIKSKASANTLQPRELSIERVDASDHKIRGSLRNKKPSIIDECGPLSGKSNGKKKQRPSLNYSERKTSALFPGNLGSRMTVYMSDVGDESDEEFVYPKYRGQNRLANRKSARSRSKLEQKSSVDSPLFSPRTPIPSQSESHFLSDAEYFKSRDYGGAGCSHQFYDSGSSVESECDDGYFSAIWKRDGRGSRSLIGSPNHCNKPATPGKEFSRRSHGYGSPPHQIGTQSDIDETLPLFWKMNPSEAKRRRKRSRQRRNPLLGTITFILFGVVCCFTYAFSTIPLADVSLIGVTNVLAAEKELVFDARLRGRNWNIWTVEISTVDIGIFATPIRNSNFSQSYQTQENPRTTVPQEKRNNHPAEYLGNLDHLDEPIIFNKRNSFSGTVNNVAVQIRLRNPGGIADEVENRWYQILRHPYELAIRGVLKYKLFFKPYAIRVCAIQGIDPTGNGVKYEPLVVCDRENWDPRDFPKFKNN